MKDKIKKTTLTTLSGAIVVSTMPLNVFADIIDDKNEQEVAEELIIKEEGLFEENETFDVKEEATTIESEESSSKEEKTLQRLIDKRQRIVDIPDARLESAIRSALNKPTGDISQGDMESLKVLNVGGKSISDLTGLEYAVNLTRLTLNNNQISDISALRNMKLLEYLNLGDNSVVDLSPLSENYSLKELALYRNKVSNVSPLKKLTSLTSLDLFENHVSDIDDLSALTKLTYLRLTGNNITNISALIDMTEMNTLILNNNQINDITPIKNMKKLRTLEAENNEVVTIDTISLLESLVELRMGNNHIEYIPNLSLLKNFAVLNMHTNNLKDISNLAEAKKLERVHLPFNEINDISCFSEMEFLNYLHVSNNKIKDISVVETVPSLNRFIISDNEVVDFSAISNMKQINNMTALELGVQTFQQSIKLIGKEIENPFVDIDGSFLELHFDNPGVSLSDDNSIIRFENPVAEQEYVFKSRTKSISNKQTYASIEGSVFIDEMISPIAVESMEESDLDENTKVITIKFSTISDAISRIVLPNGTEVLGDKVSFIVNTNGDYVFKVYDVGGTEYLETITINSFSNDSEQDPEPPTIDETPGDENDNVAGSLSNEAPVIHANNISIYVGYELNVLSSANAIDKEDGTVAVKIISSNFDNTKPGTYKVTYEATDSKGLSTTKTIHIVVRELSEDNNPYTKDIVIASHEELDIESIVNEIAKDKGLTDVEILENNVNTSKPGDYSVVFEGTNAQKEQEIHSIKVTVATGVSSDKEDDSLSTNKPSGESVETGLTSGATITLGGLFTLAGIPFLKRKRK